MAAKSRTSVLRENYGAVCAGNSERWGGQGGHAPRSGQTRKPRAGRGLEWLSQETLRSERA